MLELRERVIVLDQARDKAAFELTAKEKMESVSNRDREHYRTVTAFLDHQIAEFCSLLMSKGGETATADLPCRPREAIALQKDEDNKVARPSGDQLVEKEQEKIVESEGQVSPVSSVSPETGTVNEENMEVDVVPQQEQPATGFLAAIRRWWESLFSPKPPPEPTGSETGQPAKQFEDTATQEKYTKPAGDSSKEQAVQDSVAEKSAVAGGTGNNGLSADAEQSASGEKGAGQQQKHQQENGDEQSAENGSEGSEKAGHDEKQSGNTTGSVGSDTTKQYGTQNGSSVDKTGKAGVGRKVTKQEGEGIGEPKIKEGFSLSGADDKRTVDVGKDGNTTKKSGRKDGTGQQASQKTAGKSRVETKKIQSGSVGQGSEKKDAGRIQEQSSGANPVADTEVAKLEKSLSDAMNEFDGKLLSEQERLAARTPKQREGPAAGSGDYGAEGPLGPGGGGGIAGGGYESSEGQGDSRQPGSVAAGGGQPAPSAGGRSTIDTDDDIVARQLREAAEKETDPVLKEKLWQEYRKYKQGGRK